MVYWVIGKAQDMPSGKSVPVERLGPFESSEAANRVQASQAREAQARAEQKVRYEVVRDYA